MSSEVQRDLSLEIAHVLFMDIVGYSKLLINQQSDLLQRLNQIVRGTEQFRRAETAGKLVRLPTGDGMALAFFTSPDAPVRCAREISAALRSQPDMRLRMGIHSGPVDAVSDVNDRANVAGAGINMAQRVMDCGDAGHILLSRRVADDLNQYAEWRPSLHELGEFEVKHGIRIGVVNLWNDGVGNSEVPEKLRRLTKVRASGLRRRKMAWALASVVVIGALALGFWFQGLRVARTVAPAPAVPDKSIAVLPLENLSEEKENAFFADGIQDDVLTSLAKISDLKVISRTSVSQYRGMGAARNLREIAQALGVENILEGSVRRVGNRVLVSVQLIDARHDRHVWAERYDRTLADSIALQGEIATEIASALRAKLAPEEKARLEVQPTTNSEAYVLYLKARERNRVMANREDAIAVDQLYAQAIALDPTFAVAIARASILNSKMFTRAREPSRKARARGLADEALRLAPALGEAHLALGLCFNRIDDDYEAALRELALAAAASPNDPEILDFSGAIYLRQGRWREALAHFERAQELDPRNPYTDANDRDIVGIHMALRDWRAAAAAFQRWAQIAPENEPPHVYAQLGLAFAEFFRTGDLATGQEVLRKIPAGVDPAGTVTGTRWHFSMWKRDFAAAEKVMAEFPSDEFSPPMRNPKIYYQGLTALARGDAALAQNLFERTRPIFELRVHNNPDDAKFLAPLGKLYAYLGRKEDALRASRQAVELVPESKDAIEAPRYATNLAAVYARTGEVEQAIALIERLLSSPGGVELANLRVSWEWDPLRSDPRFQKILEGPEPKTIY